MTTNLRFRGGRRRLVVLKILAILVGGVAATLSLRTAGSGQDLSASQRRVVALGRMLPAIVAALGSAGVATLSFVRRRRMWLLGPGMAFVSSAIALAVLGPGLVHDARTRVGLTQEGRLEDPPAFFEAPPPMAGAPRVQLEEVLLLLPYGGQTNTTPPQPRLRDVREGVPDGGRVIEVHANVNVHPTDDLKKQGEWYDLATAARRLFEMDSTIDVVDITLWSRNVPAYQARMTRETAAGSEQVEAKSLPQHWEERLRAEDW